MDGPAVVGAQYLFERIDLAYGKIVILACLFDLEFFVEFGDLVYKQITDRPNKLFSSVQLKLISSIPFY